MPEQAVDLSLQARLQQQFDTKAISAQVLPLNTFNKDGEPLETCQLVVLDAEDRFMFIIGHEVVDEYIFDGFVDYEKIFKDYILTEAQWEKLTTESKATEEVRDWEVMPADKEAVLKV